MNKKRCRHDWFALKEALKPFGWKNDYCAWSWCEKCGAVKSLTLPSHILKPTKAK